MSGTAHAIHESSAISKIRDLRFRLNIFLEKVYSAHTVSHEGFVSKDRKTLASVRSILAKLRYDANYLDNMIVRIFALSEPEGPELRELVASLKIINEIVRISDDAKSFASNITELIHEGVVFGELDAYIINLHKATIHSLSFVVDAYEHYSDADMQSVFRHTKIEETKTDDLYSLLEQEILKRFIDKKLEANSIKLLKTARKLERSADHAVNIAELLLYAKEGGDISSY